MNRMSWYSRILIGSVVVLMIAPTFTGVGSGLSPDDVWDDTSVWRTPLWLQIWLMAIVFPTFVCSIFFLHRSLEARLALGGFVLSHIPMMFGLFETTVGSVAMIHVLCYSPAFFALAKRRARVAIRTPFGVWVHVMLAVLAVSLAFDLRDSLRVLFV